MLVALQFQAFLGLFQLSSAPEFAIYDDNESGGTAEYLVKDTMGDPAPDFQIVTDPKGQLKYCT